MDLKLGMEFYTVTEDNAMKEFSVENNGLFMTDLAQTLGIVFKGGYIIKIVLRGDINNIKDDTFNTISRNLIDHIGDDHLICTEVYLTDKDSLPFPKDKYCNATVMGFSKLMEKKVSFFKGLGFKETHDTSTSRGFIYPNIKGNIILNYWNCGSDL